jgi:hypothetical protein
LALFAGVALVGEGVMWPAERRLQVALATDVTECPEAAVSLEQEARSMSRAAVTVLVLLIAGTVLMVAQP